MSLDNGGKIFAATTTTSSDFMHTFALNQLKQFTGTAHYTGSVYLHTSAGGTGSYFARYISFSVVTQSGTALDPTRLLKVTSHVLYQK